jgi:REP element-mobilizing transposase RayT
MTRPLRVEFPGACYHVINRGNFRSPVFEEDRDRMLIIEKLAEFAEKHRVKVRAYCVMINHFHFFVQTQEANLGKFMQSFLTSFSVSYNLRHKTSGHVFQGRYKAFLVEDCGKYSREVTRYIHLNPARIPGLKHARLSEKRDAARDDLWSSYGRILGLRPCPKWLDRKSVLEPFPGKNLSEKRCAYSEFVESGLLTHEQRWDPYETAAAQAIIGSEDFIDKMRKGLSAVSEKLAIRRECRQQEKVKSWCRLRDVVQAVATEFEQEPRTLLKRWSNANTGRQVLLYLASVHCRGRYSLTNIAYRLGKISISGLTKSAQLMKKRLKKDRELKKQVDRIQTVLNSLEDSSS